MRMMNRLNIARYEPGLDTACKLNLVPIDGNPFCSIAKDCPGRYGAGEKCWHGGALG